MGGVTYVCVWLGEGGVGGECVRELVPGGTWGRWDKCLCFGCGGVGGVVGGGGGGGRLRPGSWRLVWCYVCVCCESGFCVDGRSRYLYIVLWFDTICTGFAKLLLQLHRV